MERAHLRWPALQVRRLGRRDVWIWGLAIKAPRLGDEEMEAQRGAALVPGHTVGRWHSRDSNSVSQIH